MPLPLSDPADPTAAPPLDTAAYALLPVPVAWCDAQGRWLGSNAAFEAFTGCRHDPAAEALLPGELTRGAGLEACQRCAVHTGSGDGGVLTCLRQAHGDGTDGVAAAATAGGLCLRALLRAGIDADALPWACHDSHDSRAARVSGLLSLRCHGPWRVVTLQPAAPAAHALPIVHRGLPQDAGVPPGALRPDDAADAFGEADPLPGFGTWSKNLLTGERHWDAQVWRFWDHAPQPGALPVDEAVARIHPDDRDEAVALQTRSETAPGRYAHRYRVLRPGAAPLRLRSLWQVFADDSGRPVLMTGVVIDDAETHRLVQTASDAQSQLNLVLALADIAIWQHDPADGLLRTSTLGWALLGLPPQPRGLPLARVAERLDGTSRRALLDSLQASQADRDAAPDGDAAPDSDDGVGDAPLELELRCRRPDGQWRALLLRSVQQRGGPGRPGSQVGVLLDLSDRFAAQQQALALAQRLEMATAAAGVGVWSVTLSDPPRVHWDAQMRRLHGLGLHDEAPMLCRYVSRHVHEADRDSVRQSLDVLVQRNEGLLDLDLRIVRPDGAVRRLATRTSVSGSPDARQLHGVVLDVTERHATEDRLREAAERAALATRGAGIGTWESAAEARDGWWDAQMFRLRGLDRPAGVVGADEMLQWLHPADRDGHQRQMRAAVDADAPTNTEFRVVWPDGTVRWLASRSTPVRDETGRTVRRIGINWDVTDARNADAARQERLLAQRESQAKARFLARISHELRTPLNAVLGFSQLLLAETPEGAAPDPATWRSRVSQVHASGEHLLALIDDVLELSSLESGELPLSLQPVALAPLAQTSLPLVELLARQHRVTLELGPLDGWVLADPVRLRQVLVNLLSNAVKYNRPDGRVTVSAEASEGWWLLRVADTGRGLSPDQLQHLFEPFNRLGAERDAIAGTGIGLAIVQASMQHMGGTVQVRSTPGVGSVFELALQQSLPPPSAPPPFEPGAPLPASPPAAGAGRPRLLYIEDNEVNMLIVRELVGQRPDIGFDGAVDGASGLAAARAGQPALILLDMQLPDMDGHAVLRQLRADPATAHIRCIAVSANAIPEDIRQARAEGFDDYWTKPLDLSAFLRALERIFGPAPAALPAA